MDNLQSKLEALELENKNLRHQNEEILQHLKVYTVRVSELENELDIMNQKEQEAVKANMLIAQSANEHVEELLGRLKELEKNENAQTDSKFDTRPTLVIENRNTIGKTDNTHIVVIKEGYILKKSGSFFQGWQKRYFVLSREKKLYWFKDDAEYYSGRNYQNCINLLEIPRTKLLQSILLENESMKIITKDKTYDLVFVDANSALSWYNCFISN